MVGTKAKGFKIEQLLFSVQKNNKNLLILLNLNYV